MIIQILIGAHISIRRSVAGYVLLFGSSPIRWKYKKQSIVSKSSSGAEYRALTSSTSEITWMVRLLEELGVSHLQPVTLFCDNKSALQISHNPVLHERMKHIAIDCHFTGEKVLDGLIELAYIPTQQQLADVFAKTLPSSVSQPLLCKLGLVNTATSLRGDVKYIDALYNTTASHSVQHTSPEAVT